MRKALHRLVLAAGVLLQGAVDGHAAESVADFYRGKTVFLQVGGDAGGGHDVLGRIVARYIGKYIPGNPNVVVQDVPGGGALELANQFGNTTPRDGTVLGVTPNGVPITPLLRPESGHYDARKFNFLGSPMRDVLVLVVSREAQVKTVEDVFTRELVVGASAPGGGAYDYPVVTNAVLGTKFKIIKGYAGGGQVKLALQRGEIQGDAALAWTAAKSDYRQMLDDKELLVLARYGSENDPELAQYPLFPAGKTEEQNELLRLLYADQDYGRPFMMPPGIPPDRLAAMRKAFVDTMADPQFAAELKKIHLDVDPVGWHDLQQLTNRLYDTPASALARLRDIMATSMN